MTDFKNYPFSAQMARVIAQERDALSALLDAGVEPFVPICRLIAACRGRVIFMGVGKSGHIGKKLAATFASTGTPSFFVHGTEAMHGDLGMITPDDIVLLLSNSGSTAEMTRLLAPLRRIGCAMVAFTARADSELARGCDYALIYPFAAEADELNLAPTCSSTLALALGDALACAVSAARGFARADFYKYHPGGALGAQLAAEETR